ncbi:hypothetical protein J6590_065903 [Homalodisca vitripennis]|nr:hypothetical protein J6590_065903 [Homalodisca vitripennis]
MPLKIPTAPPLTLTTSIFARTLQCAVSGVHAAAGAHGLRQTVLTSQDIRPHSAQQPTSHRVTYRASHRTTPSVAITMSGTFRHMATGLALVILKLPSLNREAVTTRKN